MTEEVLDNAPNPHYEFGFTTSILDRSVNIVKWSKDSDGEWQSDIIAGWVMQDLDVIQLLEFGRAMRQATSYAYDELANKLQEEYPEEDDE